MPSTSTVLLLAGSPSDPSRSAALLDAVSLRLALRGGLTVEFLNIRELPAEALLLAEWGHPAIVVTPVYKAAYSGVLKIFLDLLPQTALKHKTVLPLATGGSPHHLLALDCALRPVLQSLSARHILPGVYATDAQIARSSEGIYMPSTNIAARLGDTVGRGFSNAANDPL